MPLRLPEKAKRSTAIVAERFFHFIISAGITPNCGKAAVVGFVLDRIPVGVPSGRLAGSTAIDGIHTALHKDTLAHSGYAGRDHNVSKSIAAIKGTVLNFGNAGGNGNRCGKPQSWF